MSETADYIEETEDYTVRGGEVPEDGDDIAGEEGELVIEIIQANYPAGKTATAQDADLTAANVKSGANIFGVVGEHAPLTGDDVAGGEGALLIRDSGGKLPGRENSNRAGCRFDGRERQRRGEYFRSSGDTRTPHRRQCGGS